MRIVREYYEQLYPNKFDLTKQTQRTKSPSRRERTSALYLQLKFSLSTSQGITIPFIHSFALKHKRAHLDPLTSPPPLSTPSPQSIGPVSVSLLLELSVKAQAPESACQAGIPLHGF